MRLLEPQINGTAEVGDGIPTDHLQNTGRSWSREEVLHFLDELGWLFQRKSNSSLFGIPDYRLNRFKFLLIFSIEHDFCAVVKTLLDILLELNLGRKGLARESMAMLSEIHPLNRAVRRRCRSMVDLLVRYSVVDSADASEKYIFAPNLAGPGGVTPLHLAACTSSSDDMVDALTSDPQEVHVLVFSYGETSTRFVFLRFETASLKQILKILLSVEFVHQCACFCNEITLTLGTL